MIAGDRNDVFTDAVVAFLNAPMSSRTSSDSKIASVLSFAIPIIRGWVSIPSIAASQL